MAGKKKTSKKKAVAKRGPGKALAKGGDWKKQLAERAAAVSATEVGGGGSNFISTKGGDLTYKGDALPQPMPVIIIDYAFVNQCFEDLYDEDNPQPPMCFAIEQASPGIDKEMGPVEESPEPQSEQCDGCPMNEWGSDHRGKGKACRNTRRLAVIPADDFNDIDENTEIALLSVPPASLKFFSGHVKKVSRVLGMPPEAVVTEIYTEKMGGGHALKFELAEDPLVPDDIMPVVMQLRESCYEDMMQLPDFSGFGQDNRRSKAGRGGRGGRAAAKPKPQRKTAKKKTAKKKTAKKKTARRKY